MKLHLPFGLRKALLACLAAVASHHRLPRTVSTGTALLGIFSLLWGGTLRADEPLLPEDEILVDEEELPPAVNEIAALEEGGGILPIAATDKSTVDKDVDHKALTTEEVTYSGDIYTWDVNQHTSFHGTGGDGKFTPWVANADGSGMEDGTPTTSKTDSFWKHFATCDKNGDTITYDTLRLTGANDSVTLDTYGLSSDPGSRFGFGGLIVEAGNGSGSYTVDVGYSAGSPMALYWGAGTGTTTFKALILSDITFTNIRNAARAGNEGEVYGFHIISDADVRIAKGKSLTVQSVMQIDGGKTLTLSAVNGEGEFASFTVDSIDTTAAGDASPTVTLGNGVHMTVNGSISGSLDMTVDAGAKLTLGGINQNYHLKKLTLAGGILTMADGDYNTSNPYGFTDFEELELTADTESTWEGSNRVTALALAHKLTGSGTLKFGRLGALAFGVNVDVSEFTGEILMDSTSYGGIDLQANAHVTFEGGGKLKIQNSSGVTLREGASLVVSDSFNLPLGTTGGHGKLILENGATLELKDVTTGKAERLGGSGGTLKLNNSSLTVNTNVGDGTNTPGSLGGIEFTSEASSFTLSAGDLSVGKLTGEGSVTLTSGTLTLADTEGQSSYTGTITAAGFVYAAAGQKFTLTKGFVGANVGVTGGTLVVTGNFGKTGGTNTWTIGGNSQLDLSGASLNLGDGGELNLIVDVSIANTLGGALKLSDDVWTALQSLATNQKLTLTLTGLAGAYQLLDVSEMSSVDQAALETFLTNTLQRSNPHYSGRVSIDTKGLLTIASGSPLTWNNEKATGTWKVGNNETPWKLDDQDSGFYSNDSVIFDDASETEHTITISGAVNTADMTVRDGTWHFTASAESDTLTVAGSITIGKAAGDDPSADPAKDASVYFDSAGNISAEAITVTGGSVLQFSGTGGLTVTGDLVIESGSRVIISGGTGEPKLKGNMTFGGIEVKENAEFVVDGSMYSYTDATETEHFAITGGVHGEGSLVLEDVAASWDTSNSYAKPKTGTLLLQKLVGNSEGVGSLVLRGTSTLCIYSTSNDYIKDNLLKFDHLVVENGSQLWLGVGGVDTCFKQGATIELVGSGDKDPSTESLYFSAGETITTTINLTGTGTVKVGVNVESTLSGTLNLNGLTLQKTGNKRLIFASDVEGADDAGGLIDVKSGDIWLKDGTALSKIGVSLTGTLSMDIGSSGTGSATIGYLAGDGGVVRNYSTTAANKGTLILDVSQGNTGKAESAAKFASANDTSTTYIHLKKQGEGTQTFSATDFGHLHSIEVTAGGVVFKGSGSVTGEVILTGNGSLTVGLADGDAGTQVLAAGSVSVTGSGSFTVNGMLNTGGTFTVDGATANVKGRLSSKAYAGKLTVSNGGNVTIGGGATEDTAQAGGNDYDAWVTGTAVSGANSKLTIYGGLVNNTSTIDVTDGGTLRVEGNVSKSNSHSDFTGVLNIGVKTDGDVETVTSGTVEVVGNVYVTGLNVKGGNSSLTVGGQLKVETGAAVLDASTVDVTDGISAGTVTMESGATLKLGDAANTITTLNVNGEAGDNLELAGGTLTTALGGTGTLNVTAAEGVQADATVGIQLSGEGGSGVTVNLGDHVVLTGSPTATLGSVTGSGTISGTVLLTGTKDGTFTGAIGADANVTLNSEGNWTLGDGAVVGGTLTVNGALKVGGEMALSKQLVIGANGVIGAATDSGATLKVTLGKDEAASAGGAIAWGNNGATWDSKLKIDLSGVGLDAFTQWDYDSWGYQLFGSLADLTGFDDFAKKVVDALVLGTPAVKHMHYVLDQTGMLKVALDEDAELVWTGGNGTWRNGVETNDGWADSDDFVNGFSARFKSAGGTVALSGAIEAKNVTIETGNWTWAGGANDTLTVDGKLTVAGGTLTVNGDGDESTTITLNGDVSVESGATLTVKVSGKGAEGRFARGENSSLDVKGTLVLQYDAATNGFARMNGFLTSAEGTTSINRLSLASSTGGAVSVNLGSDLSGVLAGVKTLSVGKGVTLYCFKYATLQLGDAERANHTLELQEGSVLGTNTNNGSKTEDVTIDWQIKLAGNSTLTTNANALAKLNGTLTLGGNTLTVNGSGIAELGEKFALAGGTTGTISVTGGATLRNTKGGLDLGGVGVNLNSDGKLDVAAALTLSNLEGDAGSEIKGNGTLTLKDTEGSFGGAVSSALVYDAEGGNYQIDSFRGSSLTAKNGTLTVGTLSSGNVTVETGGGVTVSTALTDGYTGTVTLNGGIFTASGTAKSMVVGDVGGTLNGEGGGLTATLSGSGILTAQGTLTLSGTVGGLSGNGAVNNSTLTVTGTGGSYGGTVSGLTITVNEGASQAFTGGSIGITKAEVGAQGKLSLSGGTVESLADEGTLEVAGAVTLKDLSGSGSVTGQGTLTLTDGEGSFEGTVGSNLVYNAAGGSYQIGTFNGSSLTVEDGTLTVGKGTATTAEVKKGTLSLGGGTVGHLSGAGTLEVTGDVALNGSGNEIGTLKAAGGTFTVGGDLTVADVSGNGGSVAVAADKKLTVTREWTGALSGLTLGNGATLDLSAVKTSVGLGTLTGKDITGTATIVIGDVFSAGSTGLQIALTDAVGGLVGFDENHQLTLDVSKLNLNGLVLDKDGKYEYQLFDPGKWKSEWLPFIKLETGELTLTGMHLLRLTGDGKLQYRELSNGLVWSGKSTDEGVWQLNDKDSGDWVDGYFEDGEHVNFLDVGDGLKSVKVSGALKVGNMVVGVGGYSFTVNGGGENSLTVENLQLLADAGSSTTFGVNTTVTTLTGTGSILLTGRMHVNNPLSPSEEDHYTGTITLQDRGVLEASGEAKVGAAGGTLDGTTGLTATLSGDGNLTAKGKLTLSGEMGGTLQVDGATVTMTDGLSVGGLSGSSGTVSGGTLTVTGTDGSFGGTVSGLNVTVGTGASQAFTGGGSGIGTAAVAGTLSLGGGTIGALSGAGTLEVTGNVTLNGTGDSSIGTLTVNGAFTANGNLRVGTMGGTGSVTVGGGKTLTVNGWNGTLGVLTLGDGATLDLRAVKTAVNSSALTGQSKPATIVIGDVFGGEKGLSLVFGKLDGFDAENQLTLKVSALSLGETSLEYQLFGAGWSDAWLDYIKLDTEGLGLDGRHLLRLTEGGMLKYTVLTGLTWSGETTDSIWANEGNNNTKDWVDGYFVTGYDVSFTEVGKGKPGVYVSGKIVAGGMVVSAGGYSFTAQDGTDSSLTVRSLSLTAAGAENATTFGVNTTVSGALTGGGDLILTGSMSVGTALVAGEGGYTGKITLQGGTLTASGAATVEVDGTGMLDGTTGLTAELSGSGVLTAQGTLVLSGTVGGLRGDGTLSGNITVTGKDGSFGGTVNGLNITVGTKASQAFTGGGTGIGTATVAGTLSLGGGTVGTLSGAGTLEVRGNVTLNGGGGIGTLEVTKEGAFTANGNLGVGIMGGAGSVTVVGGKTLTVNGWSGKLNGLTLGDGATLDLSTVNVPNIRVDIGTLAGENATATIVIGDVSTKTAGTNGVQLVIGELTGFDAEHQLTLKVNALDLEQLPLTEGGYWGYQLFGEGWKSDWLEFIKLDTSGVSGLDGRHLLTLTGDGRLWYLAMPGLVWSGQSGDEGVWAETGNDTSDWLGGGYFTNGDDVGFTDDGIGRSDVKVSGALEVGNMVVVTTESKGYNFTTNGGENDSLTVKNLYLYKAGSSTRFGVDTTVQGTLTGAGDLVLTGKMSVVGELGESYAGVITLEGGGELEASGTVKEVKAEGGTLTGTGNGLTATLGGEGNLTARGKLTLSGTMGGVLTAGSDNPSLTVSGGLSVGGLGGGGKVSGDSLTVTGVGGGYSGTLDVKGLTMNGGGKQSIGGNAKVGGNVSVSAGTLELNGGADVSGNVGVNGGGLTLDDAVKLGKGAEASNGGMLTLRSADTTLGAGAKLKADAGGSIVLAFGEETWNHGEDGNIDIELAGGTLDMRGLTGSVNGQEVHLERLGGTGGSLVWGGGLTGNKRQTVHVGELSLASGTLNLGTVSAGQELHLEQLRDVKGEITGAADGGKVYLGNVYQGAGTSGTIDVEGGVHVHSHGGTSDGFWKQGEGSFTLKSKLFVDDGSLYVNYDGTLKWGASGIDSSAQALSENEIGVASGVTLKYADQSKLLLLGVELFEGFQNPKSLNLDLTQTDLSRLSGGFDLGIVSNNNSDALLTQLTGVIDLDDIEFGRGEDGTEGYFELSWHEEANGTYHLYLDIVGEFAISEPEWDVAWGDGLIGAPSNKDMVDHTWDGTVGDPFRYAGVTDVGGFTGHALELGKFDNLHIDGRHTLIRLTQGAAKATDATAATVVGGIIVDNADDPKSLFYDSYIEYNVDYEKGDKDHLHLLVGGSCCVLATEDGEAYASFEGTSHIQVESGTVDYIVGGNHVNNSTFTFKGDSYITVFGGQVLGSVVGGSTLTKGTSKDNLYAFNGDTNIFIYKALGGAREDAPAISDGADGGAAFAAVVGGNAWVDFEAAGGQTKMKPQYFGHTHITIDLVGDVYKGKEIEGNKVEIDGRETGVFEKSIVGGNYTAALEAPSDATERNTVFRGDTHITIAAKDATWERAEDGTLSLLGGHVFTKGVAGASRRASSGGGTTEFTGDTHIDIAGGMYREAIVGGMWFEESAVGDHAMSFTGNTEVKLHSGQFWRVVGGSYSLGGAAGASEETKGDTSVVIEGGSVDSVYGSNGEGEADIGIVVGGDFYRHHGGDSNVRTGDTQLSVKGGSFRNVHIVGGDYANFSGNEGNASITGTSRVEIGGGEITGVVVGGSYLTDEGEGGQLSVGSVEVTVSGGSITHESSEAHAHHALAVVGGNMLIDNGETHGGHNLLVGTEQELGSVKVTVSGGTISGSVVGGSYTSDHEHGGEADNDGGDNVLAAGDITINLSGGKIEGSVYGGHYSEVQDHSDVLVLGDITLNVDASEGEGVSVTGDIVGGSYRAAKSGLKETDIPAEWGAQNKGSIVLNLKRGTVTGNVWGAGYHAATEAGANPLTSVTESVTVNLGAGLTFNGKEQVLSGGYYKGSDAAHDQSVVTNAVLNLTDGEGYNLSGVTVRDFDVVNTGADVTVKELVLTEDTAASFTKGGAGVLTVQGNLTVAQGVYGGTIHVNGGRLVVGGEVRLGDGVGGGLEITLSAGEGSRATEAYLAGGSIVLQRPEGGKLGLSASFDGEPTEDYAGRYYLATGLQGIEGTEPGDWFETKWVAGLAEQLNTEEKTYTGRLRFVGESLVLYLASRDIHTWYWDGTGEGGGMTWRGDNARNWQVGDAPTGGTPNEAPEVHFTHEGEGDVHVEGTVTPGGVVVESGEYTFSGNDESGIWLSEQEKPTRNGGKVVVEEEASLDLRVKTQNVKEFEVRGRLVFSAEEAVQEGAQVTLFTTGTLGFGEDESKLDPENGYGELVETGLKDGQVTVDGEGPIHVQVGKTWEEYVACVVGSGKLPRGYVGPGMGKELGSGLTSRAVSQGIHKTGRFALTLAWNGVAAAQPAAYGLNPVAAGKETVTEFDAPIVAEEGSLIYDVKGNAGTETVFSEKARVQVYQGAELVFRQSAGRLEVSGTFETHEPENNEVLRELLGDRYAARTVLGSADDNAEYGLSGDFTGYTGVLEVVGDGVTSMVHVKDAKAIGAAETEEAAHVTLGLSGRAVVFDGEVGELYLAGVEVSGQNLLGGYGRAAGEEDPNAEISLHGKVSGDGVLANARGTDAEQTAYHHTLTGDLSGFTGRIAAGLETGDGTGASDSSWTLNLAATEGAYRFGVSGTGKVVVSAEGDITLSGVVGGDGNTVSLENAGKGSITLAGRNTSTGALVTGDGSFVLDGEGAEWAGNTLRGNGTLTLKEGTLTHAGGMSEVRSKGIVVDATGEVDVNGTQSDKLGNITVHGGSRLENVTGNLGTSDRLVRLEFGVSDMEAGADGLISFAGTPGTLTVTQGDAEHTTTGEPQSGLVLDFTAEGFVDLLKKHAIAGVETELRVVQNGGLDFTALEGGKDLLRVLTEGGGYGGLLSALGFTLNAERAAEGILTLNGLSDRVYLVLEEGETGGDPGEVHVGTDSGALERAGAVVVDQNSELVLHFTGDNGDNDVVLHNLVGLENAALTVSDERTGEEKAAGDIWVRLDNQLQEDLSGSELGDVSDGDHTVNTDKEDGFDVRGVDTIFEGTVRSGDETVNIEKSGSGRLTLGSAVSGKGGLDMKGELRFSGGGVTLQGNATEGGNAAGSLAFAYTGDADGDTGLSLKNGADMTVHDITEEGTKADGSARGGEVTLGADSVFTLDNSGKLDASGKHVGTTLRDTVFRAERDAEGKPTEGAKVVVTGTNAETGYHSQLSFEGAGAGVDGADLEVTQGAEVSVQNGAVVKDGDIVLTGDGSTLKVGDGSRFETDGKVTPESGSTLDLGTSTGNRAGAFGGSGTLSGNAGSMLTVTGPGEGMFTGTLAGEGGTLSVGDGGKLRLENVDTQATWNLEIGKGGNLGLTADEKGMGFGDIDLAGGGSLTLGDITAGLSGNLQVDSTPDSKGKLRVEVGDGKSNVKLGTLKLQDKNGKNLTESNVDDFFDVTFTGAGASHFGAHLRQDRDGTWYVELQRVLKNPYIKAGMHKNAQAGANLMWDVDDTRSAASAYVNGEGALGDLARLNRAVLQYYNGPDIEGLLTGTPPMVDADRTYAAVAGSSTSVLGVAGLQEVKRQLEAMRNRATTLGDATVNADPGARMYSFWMNAETGYHKADADGWAPGYTLDGWGGSIGECTSFAHGITAGLALTAMYNDLKTDSADSGTGDLDVTYLSGYVRMQRGAWSHTLVATYGEADITLNRTVNYAVGASYRAHGETDGYMMGLMYEVTRSLKLNNKGSMVLQPVFNVQLRHAEADGYDETGSDAGLHVDDIDATVVTFGLGARLQSAISENAFGRRAVVETRLLAKADAGDSEGQTTNRLLHGTMAQEVESADTGKYGIEVGVGLTIPVGSRGGAFFIDGSMEVRENYQEYNAGGGYRVNF